MSGGKGGSTSSSVEIPAWLQGPAERNLQKAEQFADIGYMPYYGPDVAAQTQNQLLGNQATYNAAAAFGLVPQGGNANAGMPTPTTYDNGITGYSSGGLYDQAVAELAARRPGQADAYNAMFVDPYTGAASVPEIIRTAETDPTLAMNMYDQRFTGGETADGGDPISSAEAYRRGQAFLNPQTAADKALRMAIPFFLTPALDAIHKANIKQYEAEVAANEPFSGAYNLGGSGLTQDSGGGWQGSASEASRGSEALGSGGAVGSQGGNAANGFSFGGW